MSSSPIMFALILLISRLFEQVGRGRGVVEWNTLSHVPLHLCRILCQNKLLITISPDCVFKLILTN